jgi:hypothetical protein
MYRSKKYLKWLRDQVCVGCLMPKNPDIDVVPMHQRRLGGGGVGIKPPDSHCLPGCTRCHNLEHHGFESFSGYEECDVALLCVDHIVRYVGEQGRSRELLDHITKFLEQEKL